MQKLFIRRHAPLVLLVFTSLMTACGFHLRESAELAPVLEKTYIDSRNPYQGITPLLRGELKSAGASVVDEAGDASAILVLVSERSLRRVLSVGSGGKASEYELFEEVTFSLLDAQGETLLEPQTLSMTRDMVFDETELLGKVAEGEDIKRQMRRNLARQIMTRIAVGMRNP